MENENEGEIQKNIHNMIGFVSDTRRMNVAITRAKFSLLIVGHGRTLSTDDTWFDLLEFFAAKKNYVKLISKAGMKGEIIDIFNDRIPYESKIFDIRKPDKINKEKMVYVDIDIHMLNEDEKNN